jgi:DNA-binding CsgD family transcriptional regulator
MSSAREQRLPDELRDSSNMEPVREAGERSGPVVSQILLGIFEAVNCGAILLDKDKCVLSFNARAEKCLGGGIMLSNARLCARDRPCDVMLQTALDQALKYREAPSRPRLREAVGLARGDKSCIVARVLPIRSDARTALGEAALIVILIDPEDCAEPSYAILEQVFGLTKTEARVATRLMCGQSLQGVADETGVSAGTVRSHIKSVFAKTNTNRQAQLVGLLTRLAMVAENHASPQPDQGPSGRVPLDGM